MAAINQQWHALLWVVVAQTPKMLSACCRRQLMSARYNGVAGVILFAQEIGVSQHHHFKF